MPMTVTSLDPHTICRELLLSGCDLGSMPARRLAARAICRKMAEGQPWSRALRRAIYESVVAPERVSQRHMVLISGLVTEPLDGPYLIARALVIATPQAWGRAIESTPLARAVQHVVDAHFRLGLDRYLLPRLRLAVTALDEGKTGILRGLLTLDLLETGGYGSEAVERVERLYSASGQAWGPMHRKLLDGPSGLPAASLLVMMGGVDQSRADGWAAMLRSRLQGRTASEPAAFAEIAGIVNAWRDAARGRLQVGQRVGAGDDIEKDDLAAFRARRDRAHPEAVRLIEEAQDAIAADALRPHRVCIPKIDTRKSSSAGVKVGGVELPVVTSSMSEILVVRSTLLAEFPWMSDVVTKLAGQLFVSAGGEVRIRPTILVGPPGAGKTAFVRRLAELLGLPRETVDATHDDAGADLGGSSARWTNAQPMLVSRAFERHRLASILVHVDELEKAPIRPDRAIQSLFDALLTLLEPSTAAEVPDSALGVSVDARGLSWICTANSLRGIPDPLVDRMQVLRCSSPGREHVGVLSAAIAKRICADRGLPEDACEPLDDLETGLIARTWRGGSIRALTRIVERMLDARHAYGAPSIH